MTNIERFPEAFENGIPKVGGRWWGLGRLDGTAPAFGDADFPWEPRILRDNPHMSFLGFADSVNQGAAAPQKPVEKATCMMLEAALRQIREPIRASDATSAGGGK